MGIDGKELTLEDGKAALQGHIVDKALWIREKYGHFIDFDVLLKIVSDPEFVKYPMRLEFNSNEVDEGMFGTAKPITDDPKEGYVIYIHEYFKGKLGDVPALALYHLVTVNYGDFATFNEAELFGSTVLGMDQEYYYKLLCRLTDEIPK